MERNRGGKNPEKAKIDPKKRAKLQAGQIAEIVLSETGIPDAKRKNTILTLAQALQRFAENLQRHQAAIKEEEEE